MQVLVVDVGVVVTEGVVEMTIVVVVVVVAEEWKLVLGTGTAHRKWSVLYELHFEDKSGPCLNIIKRVIGSWC